MQKPLYVGVHEDFIKIKKYVYDALGLTCEKFIIETESQEYGACEFEIKNRRIKFRVAKNTPTKTGQFVTFWKRIGQGPIMPYDISDPFDLVVVSVRTLSNWGQFIFPVDVLQKKGLLSKGGKGGKRAMRVYPPWDVVESKQASESQAWQRLYFLEIQLDAIDRERFKKLFFGL